MHALAGLEPVQGLGGIWEATGSAGMCRLAAANLNPMAHRQCQLRTHRNFSSVVWALTRLGSWSACVVLEVWRQPTWLYAHASGVDYVLPALPLVGVPV